MRHSLEFLRRSKPALRKPDARDGAEIWDLVRECKPLDENSMYCNLVQCDHFRDTCVVAEVNGKIVGWVSGYVLPKDPETLFVWQVAVSEQARGTGLGGAMLDALLRRDACRGVKRLQTTITTENQASWALFRKFAERLDAEIDAQAYFTRALHFRDRQGTEHMVTIHFEERMRKAA
jgi:L-2,4-diaminobutyric acid acetyltransferase